MSGSSLGRIGKKHQKKEEIQEEITKGKVKQESVEVSETMSELLRKAGSEERASEFRENEQNDPNVLTPSALSFGLDPLVYYLCARPR